MNNKELENKKDEIAGDMAMALISYVESHLIETVGWHLDGPEFNNAFDTDEDYLEMHEAVIDKLIDMLSGKE